MTRSTCIGIDSEGYFQHGGRRIVPVGVNYYPSSCGMNFWRQWPEQEMQHDLDVVGGVYLQKRYDQVIPVFNKLAGEQVNEDGLARVRHVGTGKPSQAFWMIYWQSKPIRQLSCISRLPGATLEFHKYIKNKTPWQYQQNRILSTGSFATLVLNRPGD